MDLPDTVGQVTVRGLADGPGRSGRGTLPWSDAPFEISRVPADKCGVPAGGVGVGDLLVTVTLVDADDGTIRALRGTTWPATFVDAVKVTVQRLIDNPAPAAESTAALDQHYASTAAINWHESAQPGVTGGGDVGARPPRCPIFVDNAFTRCLRRSGWRWRPRPSPSVRLWGSI